MTNPLLSPSPLPYRPAAVRGHRRRALRRGRGGRPGRAPGRNPGHRGQPGACVLRKHRPGHGTVRPAAAAGGRVLLHPRFRRRLGRHPRPRDRAVPAFFGPPGRRLPQPGALRALRRDRHAASSTPSPPGSWRSTSRSSGPVRHPARRRRPGAAQGRQCRAVPARHGVRPARQGGHEVRGPAAGRRRRPRRPARRRRRQRRRGRPHRRARGQVPADPDPAEQPACHGRPGEPGGPPSPVRGLHRPRQRRRQPRCARPGQGHGPAPRREGQPARVRELTPNSAWTGRRHRTSRPCRP